MNTSNKEPSSQAEKFAQQATQTRASFFSEYLYLLKSNRKWWMLPLAFLLLAFGGLMVLSATGAAPFIYTLF
ncbi:MAG: DUF5989 family protein [Planctomycetota bacterium]|mgnify:CR=1 FL=1